MSSRAGDRASIYVLAGTNGAGKSSVQGEAIRSQGRDYFNPDEATRQFREENPELSQEEANSMAWNRGKQMLERAIAQRRNFAFETTLGGNTITRLLEQAADAGLAVRIWYVGLSSPELHIERVRARVAAGGHDIPEEKIRARYEHGIENLRRLLPRLTQLELYDNSARNDPKKGQYPKPLLILRVVDRKIAATCEVTDVPEWAKGVFVAAIREFLG